MPELPEVETIRRQLEPRLVGRTVVDAWAFAAANFAEATAAIGATAESLTRRGKYLITRLDDDRELIVHLGMTGRVWLARGELPHDPHVRARWRLDDGTTLGLSDVRRFGRVAVVPAGCYETLPTLRSLGPEPFDPAFTPAVLRHALNRSSARVKTQLLGQRAVAGVGNIYADEALWLARIDPGARAVSPPQAVRLHAALLEALDAGIVNGGTTFRDYRAADGNKGRNQHSLRCYGRAGLPCLRCGRPLQRQLIDGRGTTWCPHCQRPSRRRFTGTG